MILPPAGAGNGDGPAAAGQLSETAGHPDDETARILAEHGTPEQRLSYALMEAGRRKQEAYSVARARLDADGETAAARQRYAAAYEEAHARWTAHVASLAAEYASEVGASGTAVTRGTSDPASPYQAGLSSGANMLLAGITHRPGGYDDSQWREHAAGFAAGARLHAGATAEAARAARQRAEPSRPGRRPGYKRGEVIAARAARIMHLLGPGLRRDSQTAQSDPDSAAAGGRPGSADAGGAVSQHPAAATPGAGRIPGRAETTQAGPAGGPDFPGAPAGRPVPGHAGRPPGRGVTARPGQPRPGRPG